MNSFVNVPNYGDERPFFDAKDAKHASSGGFTNNLVVVDGQTVYLRIYYTNSAAPAPASAPDSRDARDVGIRVDLPTESVENAIVPTAFISAANTKPRVVSDGVQLSGERDFTLSYVRGSARRVWRPDGQTWRTDRLSDALIGDGVRVGDVGWDFREGGIVSFRARVSMPPTGPVAATLPAPESGAGNQAKSGGPERPSFRCDATSYCPGPPYVALNSFTNDPVLGNEWEFLRGQTQDNLNVTGIERYTPTVQVVPGDRILVQHQVSNNFDVRATGSDEAEPEARDVRALVLIPTRTARSLSVVSYIRADNTTPRVTYGNLYVRSDQPIRLRFIRRSASSGGESLTDREAERLVGPFNDAGARRITEMREREPDAGFQVARSLAPGREQAVYTRLWIDVLRG